MGKTDVLRDEDTAHLAQVCTAASIISAALQNNQAALRGVEKVWSSLSQTMCPGSRDTLDRALFGVLLPDDGIEREKLSLGEGAIALIKAKVSALNGLIKSPLIRMDFLENGAMAQILQFLVMDMAETEAAKRKLANLVMDNFLDAGMGAILGEWPRNQTSGDDACHLDTHLWKRQEMWDVWNNEWFTVSTAEAPCHYVHVHKQECQAFRRVRRSVGKDWLPTPVRALLQALLRRGEEDVRATFELLEGNAERFREREQIWRDMELQAVAAVTYAGIRETKEEVENARLILCKIQTNAFDRMEADIGQAGIFLDPALAMANHSCTPNAIVVFTRRKALLRAEMPIEAGDEITISYIDYTKPKPFRQLGLELYHFDLVSDLGRLSNPPIEGQQNRRLELKALINKLYPVCEPMTYSTPDERFCHLRHQWRNCRPLIEAKMFASEPLGCTLENAVAYYTERERMADALSIACFAAIQSDPYRHVAPFKQWRLKGIMIIAKTLTNTAPRRALEELAEISNPGVIAVLERADQVSICQGLLLMVVKYASMAHSDEWEMLSLAKGMLRDIESLPGRERESALLQAWADCQDEAGMAYFRGNVLNPIEDLSAFAVEILSRDLGLA
ncbi:Set and mynd domain protein [Pleurostoma richardsiae]|uniref:Set and mynd domain protein n=1 Tax=Pleurostoma richardsiae TaxID=41990 RepID=A0AA38R0E1_9PEZI|nr:Set and mynd domain protein [Pleurostoma richardsiae]